MLRRVYDIALRECAILLNISIYAFCMVGFPLLSVVFFTSLMSDGVPEDLPVGVVDQDHTSESRQMAMASMLQMKNTAALRSCNRNFPAKNE